MRDATGDFGLLVQILPRMLTNRRACMHIHVHACTWDLVHDMRLSVLTMSEKLTVNVQIGPQIRFMLKSGANSVVDIASALTSRSVPTTVTTSQVYMLLIVLLNLLMVDQNATTSFLNRKT